MTCTLGRIDTAKRIRCNTVPDNQLSGLPWWCDGRIVHAGSEANVWMKNSKLAKTCRLLKEVAGPLMGMNAQGGVPLLVEVVVVERGV